MVNVYGIYNHPDLQTPCSADPAQAICDGDIILFPLPMLNKDGNITAPYCHAPIQLNDLLRYVSKDKIVLAGNITPVAKKQFELCNVQAIDYFEREDLTVTNAMLTAEGAMQTLLNNYTDTLTGARILLLGYGRIGKFMIKLLTAFGSQITVAGRRSDTRAWIESLGLNYVDIAADETYTDAYDIIINTVPHTIITANRIEALSEKCIILDLASGTGGTDFIHAQKCGIHAIHALSLPGKATPLAAGAAIKNAVTEICNDLGV